MNSDRDDRGEGPDPEEMGQPIEILIEQERAASPDFVAKVRRTIYRRTVASQAASFSWYLPKVVLQEMAGILRHLLESVGGRKDHSQP